MKPTFLPFLLLWPGLFFARSFTLKSPNHRVQMEVTVAADIRYSVTVGKMPILAPSAISLKLKNGSELGAFAKVKSEKARSVRENIVPTIPQKRSIIPDHFNELKIHFKGNFALIFRAYDDGVAYRWETSLPEVIIVENELATFVLPGDWSVLLASTQKRENADLFHTSFEEPYQQINVSAVNPAVVAYPPLLVEAPNGIKAVILESDLTDYPGMFLSSLDGATGLKAVFAGYPDQTFVTEKEVFPQEIVQTRKDYIAQTSGTRAFPWRILALSETDAQLLENDICYRLAPPPDKLDWSWVKPGTSTEEWIFGSNIYGVDFRAGINTETYKYYIDFAAQFGLEYVMLDAGWSDNNDLFKITTGMNMDSIAAYAKQRGVSLTLWTLSITLEKQLEAALKQFEKWGVRSIMTDFMDRNDQKMVAFYEKIAKACAQHKISVLFHGAYPSFGFERTFPNAIGREGFIGSEYNVWSDKATPDHDLTLPFTRQLAGAMDYEPGFMDNATKDQFRPIGMHVMSQGTRTHQLAMFVCYESPIQMFSGNPSDGFGEPEFMQFLGEIPTVWDQTKAVEAKVGDYLLLLRRSGDAWWIGAMNDWTPKDFELPLSILGNGNFQLQACEDGVNADRNAKDYHLFEKKVSNADTLQIHLAPGGGFVGKIVPR